MNDDSNIKIHNNSPSNRAVGIVLYIGPNEALSINTGFMVGDDSVITTAHSVYSIQAQKQNKEFGQIYFLPGAHGRVREAYRVVDHRFLPEYKDSSPVTKRFVEYALLKLERKVQNGHFLPLGTNFNHSNDNKLSLIGYSADDCVGFQSLYQNLSQSTSKIVSNSAQTIQKSLKENTWWNAMDKNILIQHKFQTVAGSGGSPILLATKDELVIIAIHMARNSKNDIRIARLVTLDLMSNIGKWAKEMNCSPPIFKDLKQDYYISSQNYKKKYEQASKLSEHALNTNITIREQNQIHKQILDKTLDQLRQLDLFNIAVKDAQKRLNTIIENIWKSRMDFLGISDISIHQSSVHQSNNSFNPILPSFYQENEIQK